MTGFFMGDSLIHPWCHVQGARPAAHARSYASSPWRLFSCGRLLGLRLLLLHGLLTLRRRHVLPALPQLLLLVRRELLVLLVGVRDLLLLIRRQLLEGFVALSQARLFGRRQLAEALPPCPGLGALCRIHLRPAVGRLDEVLLAFGAVAVPFAPGISQGLLFRRRERTPGDGDGVGGSQRRGHRCCRSGRSPGSEPGESEQESEHAPHRASTAEAGTVETGPGGGTGVPWRPCGLTLEGSRRENVMGSTQLPSAPCQSA